MDDNPIPPAPGPEDGEEPLAELARLAPEVSRGFWSRVHRKIDRRVAAGHVTSFAWNLPRLVFIEFVGIAFSLFPTTKDRKGGPR